MQIARWRGEKEYSDVYELNLKKRSYIETHRLDVGCAGFRVRAPASSEPPHRVVF